MNLSQQLVNLLKLALRRSPLAPVLRRLFRRRPHDSVIEIGNKAGWDSAAQWLLSGRGGPVLENSSFHGMLRDNINVDIETEFLLTAVRKELLLGQYAVAEQARLQELECTLVWQCINNEYVWYVSKE
jgi:hypothetical protein